MADDVIPLRAPASRRAYEFAKWAILSGVYPADSAITEAGLAREVGLSRTLVREALLRLEVEGLVSLQPRRGAVVTTVSLTDVEDVLEARALVENHTARRSFANRVSLLPEVAAVDAADNRVLSSVYRTLRERQTLFTSVMVRGRDDRMQAAIDEHDRILETLRGDDRDAFCAAVDEHLQWSIALARESR